MIPYDILKKDFEELKNYTTISKKYNISINIIKTWFKKYRILNNEDTNEVSEVINEVSEVINEISEDTNDVLQETNEVIEYTEEIIKNKCIDCNITISDESKRCKECRNFNMFKENLKNKQSYEQLKKDMIELKYFTSVAKKYNVSDNCIRKWIKI
jgi:transposase